MSWALTKLIYWNRVLNKLKKFALNKRWHKFRTQKHYTCPKVSMNSTRRAMIESQWSIKVWTSNSTTILLSIICIHLDSNIWRRISYGQPWIQVPSKKNWKEASRKLARIKRSQRIDLSWLCEVSFHTGCRRNSHPSVSKSLTQSRSWPTLLKPMTFRWNWSRLICDIYGYRSSRETWRSLTNASSRCII